MANTLDVVLIVVAGLMVGSELAIAAFIHPTLDRLADEVHLASAAAIARILGRVMPFWYGLVAVLTLAEMAIRWHFSGYLPRLITASAVLWIFSIVYSIAALVPINNRIGSWTESAPPANWKSYRRSWDRLHRWRVVLLLVAFTLVVTGILRRTF